MRERAEARFDALAGARPRSAEFRSLGPRFFRPSGACIYFLPTPTACQVAEIFPTAQRAYPQALKLEPISLFRGLNGTSKLVPFPFVLSTYDTLEERAREPLLPPRWGFGVVPLSTHGSRGWSRIRGCPKALESFPCRPEKLTSVPLIETYFLQFDS